MRLFFARILKPLLALTAAAVMMQGLAGCSKPSEAAPKAPEAAAKAPEATAKAPEAAADAKPGAVRTVALTVTDKGYEPSPITLKKGEPVKLVVTRTTDQTCATEVVMKEHNINTPLPLNTPVEIAFTPDKAGELRYGCAMGMMMAGTFLVE